MYPVRQLLNKNLWLFQDLIRNNAGFVLISEIFDCHINVDVDGWEFKNGMASISMMNILSFMKMVKRVKIYYWRTHTFLMK
jgi:hypothetical protein